MTEILVVGGGSWGTAFADYLAKNQGRVKLWVREEEVYESIRDKRENSVFLPGFKLSENVVPVLDLKKESDLTELLIFAVPSKYIRGVFNQLKVVMGRDSKIIVNLSKGFEANSLKTISQIAGDIFGPSITSSWVTISGPSFARELAAEHPTAVVCASKNKTLAKQIQTDFSTTKLRLYRSEDLIGTEVGGSLKNIVAIASGMVKGLGYGYNTTASLVTRASVEISRLGLKLGAKPETFWGLAGVGDLMLTCFGTLSRNFRLGEQVAQGKTLHDIETSTPMVAEGVETTKAVKILSQKLDVEMPIVSEVYEVLFNCKPPIQALKCLMKRSLKEEWNIN